MKPSRSFPGFRVGLILGVATLIFAPALPSVEAPSPTSAEVAARYTTYQQITKEPVSVSMELASLCIGASQKQVEDARRTHGPHANAFVLIFMNDPAAGTFTKQTNAYPVGSVVVKQKHFGGYRDEAGHYGTHGSANGVGGMIKRPAGYDPEHGDWEYFYFDDPKQIETGRIASCVQCHAAAKRTDYVFGSWAHPGNPFAQPAEVKWKWDPSTGSMQR